MLIYDDCKAEYIVGYDAETKYGRLVGSAVWPFLKELPILDKQYSNKFDGG